jgi:hypothetical protein
MPDAGKPFTTYTFTTQPAWKCFAFIPLSSIKTRVTMLPVTPVTAATEGLFELHDKFTF